MHECGLVHWGLKPGHIILAEDGLRIIGVDIARLAADIDCPPPVPAIGTVSFMSPEQVCGGKPVDSRSDIFAFGGVLAYASTGRGPFDAATLPDVVRRVVSEPPGLRGISGPLREIISACLAKDPAGRPSLNDLLAFLFNTARPGAVTASKAAAPPAAESAPAPTSSSGQGTATAGLPEKPQ